jgi:hypothetical protein
MPLGTQKFVRLVRRVVVQPDQSVEVTDLLDMPWWKATFLPARGTAPRSDASPREQPAQRVRWSERMGPLEPLAGGYRLEIRDGAVVELLDAPRELREGSRKRKESHVLPVDTLYPWLATLHEQDGTELMDVIVAMWSDRERQTNEGTYSDREAEAPIEFALHLQRNRHLMVGSQKLNVLDVQQDLTGPRTRLSVRRIGG